MMSVTTIMSEYEIDHVFDVVDSLFSILFLSSGIWVDMLLSAFRDGPFDWSNPGPHQLGLCHLLSSNSGVSYGRFISLARSIGEFLSKDSRRTTRSGFPGVDIRSMGFATGWCYARCTKLAPSKVFWDTQIEVLDVASLGGSPRGNAMNRMSLRDLVRWAIAVGEDNWGIVSTFDEPRTSVSDDITIRRGLFNTSTAVTTCFAMLETILSGERMGMLDITARSITIPSFATIYEYEVIKTPLIFGLTRKECAIAGRDLHELMIERVREGGA